MCKRIKTKNISDQHSTVVYRRKCHCSHSDTQWCDGKKKKKKLEKK